MIVLAENDDATRTVLAHSLQRSGYEVAAVADGQLVWPAIEAGGVELLIVDLRMPGMNGWEVLRRLREVQRFTPREEKVEQLPVIVISAQSDPETRTFAARLGAAAFMAKPIDLRDLGRTVRKALRAAHG
jgi:CheY-like chemotaxis protein